MHDAAAAAIGIATMLPLMRAAGIKPNTNTARFMMLSVPFACSAGGMGTLVGGGRCMVSAAFLKEFTGIEIILPGLVHIRLPGGGGHGAGRGGWSIWSFRPNPEYKLPRIR
jgi:sodium-dependent dicarboxylate transporter 2/3/5